MVVKALAIRFFLGDVKFSFRSTGHVLTRSVFFESDRIDDQSAGSAGGTADPWCMQELAEGVDVTYIPMTAELEWPMNDLH